jgi:chaperonin GroES
MRAIQDRVLVEPLFAEEESGTGIFLGHGEMTNEGVVLAVGPGRKTKHCTIPMSINVGDKVLFTTGAGVRTKVKDKKVLVLRESDVLGVLGED